MITQGYNAFILAILILVNTMALSAVYSSSTLIALSMRGILILFVLLKLLPVMLIATTILDGVGMGLVLLSVSLFVLFACSCSNLRILVAMYSSVFAVMLIAIDLPGFTQLFLLGYFLLSGVFIVSSYSFTDQFLMLSVIVGLPFSILGVGKLILTSFSESSYAVLFASGVSVIVILLSAVIEANADSVLGQKGSVAILFQWQASTRYE